MRFFEQQAQARGLTLRLVVLFALAVAATAAGMHLALSGLFWLGSRVLHTDIRPLGFWEVNVGLTLLLILGGSWLETLQLRSPEGAQRLARRLGARELRSGTSPDEQRLANVVDEVCIAAHMPRPVVMLVPRAAGINAFACGWDPEEAVLAVTQGALDLLDRDELQGLVAHECSHLLEGDTRLNMRLAGMVWGLELVWDLGDRLRGIEGRSLHPMGLLGLVVMGVGLTGWWAGRFLQAAVSRQREFLADARAVQWTRSRDGLGGVLRKVQGQRNEGIEPASWAPAVRHLLLVEEGLAHDWLASHPPLSERIRRIYGRPMPALRPQPDTRPTPVA